jgi:hypothetical protein
MDVIHLHPEDLLDQDRTGARDPRVAAHLAECEACRLAELLRSDFAEDPASTHPPRLSQVRTRRKSAARRALVAGVVAVFAVAAFAITASATHEDAPIARRAHMERASHRGTRTATRDARRRPETSAAVERAERAASSPDEAGDLFRQARALRLQRDYDGARRLYLALVARHPATDEARAARVIVARMLLDDRDPAAALPLFDAYLVGGDGAMREEALVGRALALDASARSAEGREAWRTLLRSFPGSAYADHAIARVAGDGAIATE